MNTITISDAIRNAEQKSVDAEWDGRYKEADYWRMIAHDLRRASQNGELYYVLF